MAKISARGATEVARVKTNQTNAQTLDFYVTFVLTSDGRVLRKAAESGYGVVARVTDPANRNQGTLERYVRRLGYEVP